MRLEYRLTFKDYQEAIKAHFKSNRFLYLYCWICSVLFIAIGFFIIYSSIFLIYKNYFWGFMVVAFGIILNPSFNPINPISIGRLGKVSRFYKKQ